MLLDDYKTHDPERIGTLIDTILRILTAIADIEEYSECKGVTSDRMYRILTGQDYRYCYLYACTPVSVSVTLSTLKKSGFVTSAPGECRECASTKIRYMITRKASLYIKENGNRKDFSRGESFNVY
jgi:hypothetical protein